MTFKTNKYNCLTPALLKKNKVQKNIVDYTVQLKMDKERYLIAEH
jgi:hypothetical protein